MKRKLLLVIAVLLVVAFLAVACAPAAEPAATESAAAEETTEATPAAEESAAAEPTEEAAATDEPAGEDTKEIKKIGVSLWTMEWEFFQLMEKGFEAATKDAGLEYVMHDEKADAAEMVSGCQNLINQGIDALVVSPFQPDSMPPIVEAAHAKGIPVVICDIGTGDSNYDAFLYSDNYGGGKMNGEYVLQQLQEKGIEGKEIATIRPAPEHTVSQKRCDGALEVLVPEGYEVVKDLYGTGDTPDALTKMQDILAANPDVVAVICGNDMAAAGAAQAAMDAGKTDILITGFDVTEQGIEGMKNGSILSSVQQFPYDMGYDAVNAAIAIAKGETITYDDEATKEIYVDVKFVTADNIIEDVDKQEISITGLTRSEIGM